MDARGVRLVIAVLDAPGSQWVRNVMVNGELTLRTKGRDFLLQRPQIIPLSQALPAYSPLSRRMMKSRRSSILSYRLIRSCRVITNGEVELLWPNTLTGISESTMGSPAERAGLGTKRGDD